MIGYPLVTIPFTTQKLNVIAFKQAVIEHQAQSSDEQRESAIR